MCDERVLECDPATVSTSSPTPAWSLGSYALWALNCGRITTSRPVNDLDVVRLLWATTRGEGSVCSVRP